MSFIDADQDWEDEINKLRADLAAERLEREQTQSVLDAERAEHEGVQAELLRTRSEAREQRDAERTARESSEKERTAIAAALAKAEDFIDMLRLTFAEEQAGEECEGWVNGRTEEDMEPARRADAILAEHDARLTAPLERRVGELERALQEIRHTYTKDCWRSNWYLAYKVIDKIIHAAPALTPREGTGEPKRCDRCWAFHYVNGDTWECECLCHQATKE